MARQSEVLFEGPQSVATSVKAAALFRRWAAPVVLIGCILGLGAGCGASRRAVILKGTVSIKGTPVEKGSISFTPLDAGAGQALGAPIARGVYVARGVPPGRVLVTFNATRETGKTIMHYSTPSPEIVNLVPAKYRSGIEIQVTPETREQNFDLTD